MRRSKAFARVRFGSLADIKAQINHVRFTFKKRHDYLSISLNFKLASKGPPIRALKKVLALQEQRDGRHRSISSPRSALA